MDNDFYLGSHSDNEFGQDNLKDMFQYHSDRDQGTKYPISTKFLPNLFKPLNLRIQLISQVQLVKIQKPAHHYSMIRIY